VVIYLGMRVNRFTGIKTLFGFGPKITRSINAEPSGLLSHENFLFSLFPPHVGMRQYWRDFASLESWARSEPHRIWWQQFLWDSRGTGFRHEAYFLQGGVEAIYDNMVVATGFLRFAPATEAHGSLYSARRRAQQPGKSASPISVSDDQLHR
jgi:hypothetical protein